MKLKLDENLGKSTAIAALQHEDIAGRLWIVEKRRIRQYRPDTTEEE